jgi:hypothetical protein
MSDLFSKVQQKERTSVLEETREGERGEEGRGEGGEGDREEIERRSKRSKRSKISEHIYGTEVVVSRFTASISLESIYVVQANHVVFRSR